MNLKLRLQKLEAAIIPKVVEVCRSIFRVNGDTRAWDDAGKEFRSIDDARAEHPVRNEYTCIDRDQVEMIKKNHEMADTI